MQQSHHENFILIHSCIFLTFEFDVIIISIAIIVLNNTFCIEFTIGRIIAEHLIFLCRENCCSLFYLL